MMKYLSFDEVFAVPHCLRYLYNYMCVHSFKNVNLNHCVYTTWYTDVNENHKQNVSLLINQLIP